MSMAFLLSEKQLLFRLFLFIEEERMPSFDIVSEVDLHEVRNAVENAQRELTTRWDFRNVEASFELNEKTESVKTTSVSEFQVQQLLDILREKMAKRG
ncbi:DUF520 family protein, partial [Staphylococcus aureus]|nr:DUF520 family protein [Staphylococcus aureus]